MRGRKPKPTKLKIIDGNPGKRPLNQSEPMPASSAPSCPDHLDDLAREEWNRLAPQLTELGLLTELDRSALAAYCDAYSRWARAKGKLDGEEVVEGKRGARVNPWLYVLNRALREMHSFLSEFGLSPSSRTRLDVKRPDAEEDEMSRFLRAFDEKEAPSA